MMKNAIKTGAVILGICVSSLAQAQSPTPQQAYQQALSYCTNLTAEAQKNCKRDAAAAYNQAQKQGQSSPNMDALTHNRVARCNRLPSDRQADCKAQMTSSYDTKVYGSVEGGGILRQSTIEIPGEPITPAMRNAIPATASPQPIR